MKLSEKAMLVTLSIGRWQTMKEDKEISRSIKDQNQLESDVEAGKYMKVLMQDERIKQINTILNGIRTYYYYITFPWLHKGPNIMPASLYLEFCNEMDKRNAEWQPLLDEVIAEWPQLIERERTRRNGMFKVSDYPTAMEIKQRFYVRWDVAPMPDTDDFRVSIRQEDIDRMQGQLADVQAGINKNLWGRLYEVCNAMATTLADKDQNRFHDTLVSNIRRLVDIMPALNINNDPDIERLRLEIRDKLTVAPAKVLKEHQDIRQAVAREADALLKKMEAYS